MGQLSLKDKTSVFLSLALALMSSAAELEYFTHDWRNVTWDEARNHCQVCFKELVTVTSENIQTISQNLTFDYWVGLRKNLNSTSNSSVSWSRWANGDPLTFQNWYPGWPLSRFSLPRRYCCSCSASTTPTTTSFTTTFTDFTSPGVTNSTRPEDATATDRSSLTELTDFTSPGVTNSTRPEDATATDRSSLTELTDFTSPGVTSFTELTDTNVKLTDVTEHSTTTQKTPPATTTSWAPMDEQCAALPLLLSDVPDDYIEDSCVAMLSFGAWVERDCSDLLSFICYDERFINPVRMTKMTSESTVVTWPPGPSTIDHYLVEVKVGKEMRENQTNNLSYDFGELTAGVHHSVHVFPVKCGRKLNSQEVSFYTKPNKVENLTVDSVTETSVFLSWSKPAGNLDFYLIEVQGGKKVQSSTEGAEVDGLIPGSFHMFTVLSGIRDNETWSEASNITAYTKPRKVIDLKVTENTNNSLLLSWTPPEGNSCSFWATAMIERDVYVFVDAPDLLDEVVSETKVRLSNLTAGSEITLSVSAVTDNNTLHGDKMTIVGYTVPGTISDLTLVSMYDSINATWTVSSGSYSSFTAELQQEGKKEQTIANITEPRMHFSGLKTAAQYTVMVHMVSGDLKGPTERCTTFTQPLPPTNASVVSWDKNQITLQWEAPNNIASVNYSVSINASFWGHSWSVAVQGKTTHTFHDLKPGTRYDFEVRTVTAVNLSTPSTVSQFTEAEKREISLSMMCSSAEPLLCDQSTTRDDVFHQLRNRFKELLGDSVFWELEKQEAEN